MDTLILSLMEEGNIEEAKKKMGDSGGEKVDKAGAKKAMGEANAEFKKGNYEGAITHYTTVRRPH